MGINLVAANRVVLFDSSWNPTNEAQALCRTYRYGQVKSVFVYRLMSTATMEEHMYEQDIQLGLGLGFGLWIATC